MSLSREAAGAILLGGILLSAGWRTRSGAVLPSLTEGTRAMEGFAVVELFTSEGCSSCPPADALLAEIDDEARRTGRKVYPLSFHVDYWNRLGWRDPFSSAAFSARQRSYASLFGSDRVYTPQMIVNGVVEFVGSDRSAAREAIREALARPARGSISLRRIPSGDSASVAVAYAVAGADPGSVLLLALVERSASVEVARGENGGRTLRHANVVRRLDSVRAEPGRFEWRGASGTVPGRFSLVAFVRGGEGTQITGAERIDL